MFYHLQSFHKHVPISCLQEPWKGTFHYFHFIDGETEAQRHEMICPGSYRQGQSWAQLRLLFYSLLFFIILSIFNKADYSYF